MLHEIRQAPMRILTMLNDKPVMGIAFALIFLICAKQRIEEAILAGIPRNGPILDSVLIMVNPITDSASPRMAGVIFWFFAVAADMGVGEGDMHLPQYWQK